MYKVFGVFLLIIAVYMLYDVATMYFGHESVIWRTIYMDLNRDEFYLKLGSGVVCFVLGLFSFGYNKTAQHV